VALLSQLVVALPDVLLHELLDGLADDGEDDVDEPLAWQPVMVSRVWEVVLHAWILQPVLEEGLDLESFVAWSIQGLAVGGLDVYIGVVKAGTRLINNTCDLRFFLPSTSSFKK